MMKSQLYIPEWLLLSQETRLKLREMFGLEEDIGREVQNNQVICDGISNMMLANMNLEAVNSKLENTDFTDFMAAFNTLLNSLQQEEVEKIVKEPLPELEPIVIKSAGLEKAINKTIKKKINAKKNV